MNETTSFAERSTTDQQVSEAPTRRAPNGEELGEGEMACPACGSAMPDLKGGRATICPVCGFKDSCCF